MQPGSSVATSLMPGEAVPKHVAIISVTGKDFQTETIRLKTVRPFVMREIVLQDNKRMSVIARKSENRTEITTYLIQIVEELIEEANQAWREAQQAEAGDDEDEPAEPPLPIIRLRVEYTAPDGGKFDVENPQRFSNRFIDLVANTTDVVQFYRKKTGATRRSKNEEAEIPEESVLAQLSNDSVKVEKLVREFLTAQSLTILPQNSFGDAVSQFVDKDDKHAMEMFVNESLTTQIGHLLAQEDVDEDDMAQAMEDYKAKLEELFAAGHLKRIDKKRLRPEPDDWDEEDGRWEDQPGALIRSDDESVVNNNNEDGDLGSIPTKGAKNRGKAAGTTRKPAAKKPAPKTAGKGRKKAISESEEEASDVIMIDDDDDDDELDEDEEEELFVKEAPKARKSAAPAKKAPAPAKKAAPVKKAPPKQSQLSFASSQAPTSRAKPNGAASTRRVQEPSEDEISDDDDAFETPAPSARYARARR